MSIHSAHPFADTRDDPVRRLRGRVGSTVSLWTSGSGDRRAGLTVSSYAVVNGSPAHVLGAVDPLSDLADVLADTGRAVVQLLEWRHRDLADAFAGMAPAPGGAFRLGEWEETAWGPVLTTASAWAGVAVAGEPREVGWSMLLDGVVEELVLREESAPLVHRRGRYIPPQ